MSRDLISWGSCPYNPATIHTVSSFVNMSSTNLKSGILASRFASSHMLFDLKTMWITGGWQSWWRYARPCAIPTTMLYVDTQSCLFHMYKLNRWSSHGVVVEKSQQSYNVPVPQPPRQVNLTHQISTCSHLKVLCHLHSFLTAIVAFSLGISALYTVPVAPIPIMMDSLMQARMSLLLKPSLWNAISIQGHFPLLAANVSLSSCCPAISGTGIKLPFQLRSEQLELKSQWSILLQCVLSAGRAALKGIQHYECMPETLPHRSALRPRSSGLMVLSMPLEGTGPLSLL